MLVAGRKAIARSYLKFWFWVDVLALIPVGHIAEGAGAAELKSLARVLRLARLQKVLKMVKLIRVLRLVRQRAQFQKAVKRSLSLGGNVSAERLAMFIGVFMVLCHVGACLWYLLARFGDFDKHTWLGRAALEPGPEAYMACLYFTITTITTVGYGDITPATFGERAFCVVLMLVGVISYSFAISQFSSLFNSLDSRRARLKDRLDTLNSIRAQYAMEPKLYWTLRQSLHYHHSTDMSDQHRLLEELPPALQVSLSHILYKPLLGNISFFKDKSPRFVASVGPLVRPVIV